MNDAKDDDWYQEQTSSKKHPFKKRWFIKGEFPWQRTQYIRLKTVPKETNTDIHIYLQNDSNTNLKIEAPSKYYNGPQHPTTTDRLGNHCYVLSKPNHP